MEWYYIASIVGSALLGVLATFFEERFRAVKKLSKLKSEILEDKEITQEQAEKFMEKVRKIIGND